eukprot:Unigene5602_Nuclearia_a/m.17124 Unigene5602_Nuclearia_a/g.17124  ORF Unigene5602_Nuclearia_a/g.17124 Unigene5602_Nuclearia_a/m.17124 type:complete len:306 (+) Unigene5602_Nuclearia_a:835-1752(+)
MLVQVPLVLTPEWRAAEQEAVERHAEGPQVNHLADRAHGHVAVLLGAAHLGREKGRRPGRLGQRRAILVRVLRDIRHAKVRDLDVVVVREQQVGRLDVAVHNALVVQVLEPEQHVAKVHARLLLAQQRLAVVGPPHRAVLNQLKDQVDLVLGRVVDHLVQLDHIWVVALLEDGNLAPDLLHRVLLAAAKRLLALLLDNFHRVEAVISRGRVVAALDLTLDAAPELVDNDVAVDHLAPLGVVLLRDGRRLLDVHVAGRAVAHARRHARRVLADDQPIERRRHGRARELGAVGPACKDRVGAAPLGG